MNDYSGITQGIGQLAQAFASKPIQDPFSDNNTSAKRNAGVDLSQIDPEIIAKLIRSFGEMGQQNPNAQQFQNNLGKTMQNSGALQGLMSSFGG